MRISINPHQALEIQNFEEMTAVVAAVEKTRGLNDPLTEKLREDSRLHFDRRNGNFTPNVIRNTKVDESASIALEALSRLAKSDDRHYGPVAAFMLDQAEVIVGGPLEEQVPPEQPAFRDPPVRTA